MSKRVVVTMSRTLSALAVWALAACASSPPKPVDETDPNWPGPPPEASGTLDADEIADACLSAAVEAHCQIVTDDAGTHMSSCTCSAFGNAVGQGHLSISGPGESGEVDAEFELVMKDGVWALGRALRGVVDE